jgi:hypothetical protein
MLVDDTHVKDEEEVVTRLERMEQSDDERMVCSGQDLLLCQSPLDLIPLDHLLLR